MSTAVYLVVEPIEIIASDLAMNIQDYDPLATVLTALSQDAACTMLQDHTSIRLAFVHADPISFAKTKLARALDGCSAQVAFTGDAAERMPGGILVLQRPFCAKTTAALLQQSEMVKSV